MVVQQSDKGGEMGRPHTSSLGFLCSLWIRRSEDHEIRGDTSIDIFRSFGVVWPVLEDFNSGVKDLFLSLKPLFGNKGLPPRNVWLRCYGAPCMV